MACAVADASHARLGALALRLHGAHRSGRSINSCANLAPPHTGTTSLADALRPLSQFAHHLHQNSLERLYRAGARCFIITLREPVARLESAFNYEVSHPNWGKNLHLFSKLRRTKTLGALLQVVQTPSDPSHSAVSSMFNISRHGHREARWRGKLGDERIHGGNGGIIPQLEYLQGLEAHDDIELHVICTRRFNLDWTATLRKFVHEPFHPPCYLQKQLSSKACLLNHSFGCRTDDTMWTSNGCSGVFSCNGTSVRCQNRRDRGQGTSHAHRASNCSCAANVSDSAVRVSVASATRAAAELHRNGRTASSSYVQIGVLPRRMQQYITGCLYPADFELYTRLCT